MALVLAVGAAAASLAVTAMASAQASDQAPHYALSEGPKGGIATLTEEHFFVDGSTGSARVFTFSNGPRFLYFIPMIHQAEPGFYEDVAKEVRRLKARGADLYYEFIDFDAASDADKRRIRAMLGFLPSPQFYAENVSDGMVAQDNSMFLGFPGGQDVNIDVTPKELADAYEEMIGPLQISEQILTSPMDSFVMPTADATQITRVTIEWRNQRLAQAINDAKGDIVVLYGAAHGAGTLRNLQALDPRWRRLEP
jgi:hypothetical protein